MNSDLFKRLLYEEEGTTLDFKKDQYRFPGATEDEKSELLKDILGFANAWRRSEAYILIGVEDVRGGESNVVGIQASDHLSDHSLQQFVNNLTNQPVRFQYKAFGFGGKQVGIICIHEQIRPIYLKRDYGKLKTEKVYVRRGSSTDPNKPASPEEIAQMGIGSDQPSAELLVEFAHAERDDALGTESAWDAECCEMPEIETIPDLSLPQQYSFINLPSSLLDPMNRLNDDFFRELASYEFARRLFRPTRLVIANVGQVTANNVRAEIMVPANADVLVMDMSDMPDPPSKQHVGLLSCSVPGGIKSYSHRYPGRVDIVKNNEKFRVEIDYGNLQPGRRIWSDTFYIGKATSGDLSMCGLMFADNLPQPKDFTLTMSVTVAKTTMTVEELCSLPEPEVNDN